jgi:hypothetical protein
VGWGRPAQVPKQDLWSVALHEDLRILCVTTEVDRMKKLAPITVSVAVALTVALFPAMSASAVLSVTAKDLLRADVRNVRVHADTGTVAVRVLYWCDARYADAAEPHDNLAEGSNAYIDVSGFLRLFPVICDGKLQELRLKAPLPDVQVLVVSTRVHIDPSVDDIVPYPGDMYAGETDSMLVREGSPGRGAHIRHTDYLDDIELNRVSVNDRGRLVVGLWYRCADGAHFIDETDPDNAEVVVNQSGERWEWDTFVDDVVCDGQRHWVVKRFRTTANRSRPALDLKLPVSVVTGLVLTSVMGQDNVYLQADDLLTALP